MSLVIAKSNKIRHIVRIRQMLRQWRKNAAAASFLRVTAACIPSDVPAGHVAVSVGSRCTRFVVPASYLNHPIFEKLLDEAEEEYGFANQGLLTIPCEESVFEHILQIISRSGSAAKSARLASLEDTQRCCHVEIQSESGPLLPGLSHKSVY
jgi:SAUR family protein